MPMRLKLINKSLLGTQRWISQGITQCQQSQLEGLPAQVLIRIELYKEMRKTPQTVRDPPPLEDEDVFGRESGREVKGPSSSRIRLWISSLLLNFSLWMMSLEGLKEEESSQKYPLKVSLSLRIPFDSRIIIILSCIIILPHGYPRPQLYVGNGE